MTDFEKALATLDHGAIEFIVIGGVAATLHGSAFITQDLSRQVRSLSADVPNANRRKIRQGV